MAKTDVVSAQLDVIVDKARLLAAQYKADKLWDGELDFWINDLKVELSRIPAAVYQYNLNKEIS